MGAYHAQPRDRHDHGRCGLTVRSARGAVDRRERTLDLSNLCPVAGRQVQVATLIGGVVLGFILFAILRNLLWILLGIAIGAVIVMYARRR